MVASKSIASPRIDVKVTQDVIDTSTQRDSSHCMIADAIQKQLPNVRFISVDLATIRFTDTIAGKRYVYLTPRTAQEALLAFDQGEKPDPFTFRIQSAHVLHTGSARKARASLARGESGESIPIRVDGDTPPIGPLVGGAPVNRRGAEGKKPGAAAGGSTASKSGRRRAFGLKAILR